MSSHVPVIATDSVGSREIVKDGYNGYLINEGDVNKLAHCIKRLIIDDNELDRLGENARKTILENFSIETMVKQYENLYFNALGTN